MQKRDDFGRQRPVVAGDSRPLARPVLVVGPILVGSRIALVDVATISHVVVPQLLVSVTARASIGLRAFGPVALLGSPSLLLVLEAAAGLLLSVHATARGVLGAAVLSAAFELLGVLIVPLGSSASLIAAAVSLHSGLVTLASLVAVGLGLALLELTTVLLAAPLGPPPLLVVHPVLLAAMLAALVAPFAVHRIGACVSVLVPALLGTLLVFAALLGTLSFLAALHALLVTLGPTTATLTVSRVALLTLLPAALLTIGALSSALFLHATLLTAVSLGAALILLASL